MINLSFELIEYDFKIILTGCDKNIIKKFSWMWTYKEIFELKLILINIKNIQLINKNIKLLIFNFIN